jgi:cell filamentation protein
MGEGMPTRYMPRGPEAEFQPGSRGRVLRNLLGLRRVRDITLAESQTLQLAQDQAIERYTVDHRFTAEDIGNLHRSWLGAIYPWAGQYRTVNMGKGGFQFANAALIPKLMQDLEEGALARLTPCLAQPDAQIAHALAVVHAELVLIHPFREGNGRLARLLAMLMALQAGLPPLDFTPMSGRGKSRYIEAIHAATGHDYRPLAFVFERIIGLTWKRVASSGR